MLPVSSCYTVSQSVIVFHWCPFEKESPVNRADARSTASNMIVRRLSISLLQLIVLTSVANASKTRWNVLSWVSTGVCTLVVFPSASQQWSLLGLDLWPSQTVEKPSNGPDTNGNSISRGEFLECCSVFLLCSPGLLNVSRTT